MSEDLKALLAPRQQLLDLFPPRDQDESILAAARQLVEARRVAEDAAKAKRRADEIEAATEKVLESKLVEAKLHSIKIDVDGKVICFSRSTTAYYSVLVEVVEQDPTFKAWLAGAGGLDLMKERVNPQSFSKFCRELKEAGRDLHPMVKVAEKSGLTVKGY